MIHRGTLMSCGNKFKHKAQKAFDKVVEWDKKLIKKFQDKFNLTDYQMLCLAFGKVFILGALIL